MAGEKHSADSEAAESYVDKLAKSVLEENLSPAQIYNANERALFGFVFLVRHWQLLMAVREATLTVLDSSSAAGTHKNKLLVIG